MGINYDVTGFNSVEETENENISNNNNANTTNTTTNNFTSYDLNRYNMMEEDTKVNLDVFTRINNENPYTSASTSVNDKIIIRPRGNN